jgi:hypothetical protein
MSEIMWKRREQKKLEKEHREIMRNFEYETKIYFELSDELDQMSKRGHKGLPPIRGTQKSPKGDKDANFTKLHYKYVESAKRLGKIQEKERRIHKQMKIMSGIKK